MKNVCFILLLFATCSVFSQNFHNEGLLLNPDWQPVSYAPTDDVCLGCDNQSIFSNNPDIYAGAGISDDQRCFTSYDNFVGLTQPFNKVVFWGYDITYAGDYTACTVTEEKEFAITFYENNSGNVGNTVTSFVVTPVKSFCVTSSVFNFAPLYRYEVLLNSAVNMSEGWMSVRAIGGTDGCWFAWTIAANEDQMVWQDCDGYMNSYALDLAFCLSSEETPTTIPVSNWALIFGILLIVAFTVIRWIKTT